MDIKRENDGKGGVLFTFSGAIDDTSDFEQIGQDTPVDITLDFDGVENANSYGVRRWAQTLQNLKGKKLRYTRCRPVVVVQMNVIPFLTRGVEVKSFYVPMSCEACSLEYDKLVTPDDAMGDEFVESLNERFVCDRCARKLEFVEDEATYFRFLLAAQK